MKKIKDYFPIGNVGLFSTFNNPLWINAFPDSEELDLYFTMRYGEKTAADFMNAFLDSSGELTTEGRQRLAKVIYSINFKKWEHLFKVYNAEYNPLENTDFVETINDKTHKNTEDNNITTGKTTTSNENVTTGRFTNDNVTTGKFSNADVTTGKTATTKEVNVAGFDSVSNVPQSDESSTTDYTYDGTDPLTVNRSTDYTGDGTDPLTVTITTDYGDENGKPLTVKSDSTIDYGTKSGTPLTVDATGSEDVTYEREYKKHGNIGITSTVTLMTEEKNFWKWSFIDAVCLDICDIIALSIYNY